MAASDESTTLPPEVEAKIETNLKNDLRQKEVAEVFYDAERPYLERSHVQQRVDGNYTRDTVQRRLKELVDAGILRQDTTGNADQYWVANEYSHWMIPDDVVVKSEVDPEAITLRELVNDKLTRDLFWGLLMAAISGIMIIGLVLLVGVFDLTGIVYNVYAGLVLLSVVGALSGAGLIVLSITKAKWAKGEAVLTKILPF